MHGTGQKLTLTAKFCRESRRAGRLSGASKARPFTAEGRQSKVRRVVSQLAPLSLSRSASASTSCKAAPVPKTSSTLSRSNISCKHFAHHRAALSQMMTQLPGLRRLRDHKQ